MSKPPHFDTVILSANEDPLYIDFWPDVAWAYKRMFPNVEVQLAFLTRREDDDPLVLDLAQHGTVWTYAPIPGVPEPNQAKMARHYLASKMGNKVVYINDVDLFPLSADWICEKTSQRPDGKFLLVGAEVYDAHTPEEKDASTAPASMMTGEGWLWKQFINPWDYTFQELMKFLADPERAGKPHSRSEDITNDVYHENCGCFSDEHMIRRMMRMNPVPKHHVDRGYVTNVDTLDRMGWRCDEGKLYRHEYLEAHMCRPRKDHPEKAEQLLKYIEKTYHE